MSKQVTVTIDKSEELLYKLLHSETAEEIIQILKQEMYWDDDKVWQSYGGNDSNYSIIGNQSSNAIGSIVEKIINSVDTVLELECLLRGIDPRSRQAPNSMLHATELFWGIAEGKLENAEQTIIKKLAENIHLTSSGGKNGKNMCLTQTDRGTGRSPDELPETILSMPNKKKTNKTGIQFQQGLFNMGGSGYLTFCKNGISLIISRKNPKLLNSSHHEDDEMWGFTITRKLEPKGKKEMPRYQYLAPNGKILRFKSKSINALPGKYPSKYSKPFDFGTCIKSFEYKLNGFNAPINLDLNYELSKFFHRLAVPMRIEERREGYKAHTHEVTLSGMSSRLEDDRSKNLEFSNKSGLLNIPDVGEIPVEVYVFKPGVKRNRWQKGSEISLLVNGQRHGRISKSLLRRQSVGLDWLADDMMIFLDTTDLPTSTKLELFMADRERIKDVPEGHAIQKSLEKFLAENEPLQKLAEKRRQDLQLQTTKDDKFTNEMFSQLLSDADDLHDFFPTGTNFKKKTDFDWIKTKGKFKGEEYPTFFRLENRKKKITVKCPIQGFTHLTFETDAENNYLGRSKLSGKFTCTNKTIFRHLDLFCGTATLRLQAPKKAKLGQRIKFQTKLKDKHTKKVWTHTITLRIVKSIKPSTSKPGDPSLIDPWGFGKGFRKLFLGINVSNNQEHNREKKKIDGSSEEEDTGKPNIYLVRNTDELYNKLGMTPDTGLISKYGTDSSVEFYVNGDNKFLERERITNQKESPQFLTDLFKIGLGFACFGIYLTNKKNQGKDEEDADIFKKIDEASNGLAMTMFPVTSHLAEMVHHQTNAAIRSCAE